MNAPYVQNIWFTTILRQKKGVVLMAGISRLLTTSMCSRKIVITKVGLTKFKDIICKWT